MRYQNALAQELDIQPCQCWNLATVNGYILTTLQPVQAKHPILPKPTSGTGPQSSRPSQYRADLMAILAVPEWSGEESQTGRVGAG
ncbi:MAG: hypothetical protein ACFB12_09115 [Leptolyngbyaceae cyanobacterium]